MEQDLRRRLGRQGRGDPAQHRRVEDLVGDEQPAHPERVRREQLVARRDRDAPRTGIQLGGEQLGDMVVLPCGANARPRSPVNAASCAMLCTTASASRVSTGQVSDPSVSV